MKNPWKPDGLGRTPGYWFAYPVSPEGITVKVVGDDPQGVCDAANLIEAAFAAERGAVNA